MCRRVKCGTCGKTTWAGCGAHIDQVLAGIAKDDLCQCKPEDRAPARGFLARLFGL